MIPTVEGILDAYEPIKNLDEAKVAEFRTRLMRYVETIAPSCQMDGKRLHEYGSAYLKELNEGRDPRFTGC
jgi:hypothetical protein